MASTVCELSVSVLIMLSGYLFWFQEASFESYSRFYFGSSFERRFNSHANGRQLLVCRTQLDTATHILLYVHTTSPYKLILYY